MKARSPGQKAALIAAVAALSGTGWVVFGSAATLTVTPKNASSFRTCVLTGYPTTSSAMSDAWVDELLKTTNKGNTNSIQIRSSSLGDDRAFLRFDLVKCVPAIPSATAVKKATLRIHLGSAPGGSRTYNLNRVTAPCSEAATTCWTETGLTWNNQPAVAASATSTLALTSSSAKQYYTFDVTADVTAIVAGTASNYGWRIADSAEGNSVAVTAMFDAKDATADAAGAPGLVIVYSP